MDIVDCGDALSCDMTGCACGIREDWGAHLSKRFTGNVVAEMMPGPLPALQIINKTKTKTTTETQNETMSD